MAMRSVAVVLGIATCVAASTATAKHPGDRDYYGVLTIRGDRPVVIVEEPRVVHPRGHSEPLYVRVPPGHAKHWEKHCAKYRACERPVYFVDDHWYHEHYVVKAKRHGKKHDD